MSLSETSPSCEPMAAMPTMGEPRVDAAGRAVEMGVAEREDPAIGGDEPVTGTRLAQGRVPITPRRNRHFGGAGTRLGCHGLAVRNRGDPAGQDQYEQNSPQGRERPCPRPAEALRHEARPISVGHEPMPAARLNPQTPSSHPHDRCDDRAGAFWDGEECPFGPPHAQLTTGLASRPTGLRLGGTDRTFSHRC